MVKFLFSWLSSLLSQSSVRWCVLCCVWGLGYSRKNPSSWNFYIYHLTSGKKLSPLEILETCVTPLGNSKVKNKDSWKFHTIFSWTPVEIPLLFNEPWNFHMLFHQYHWKFQVEFPSTLVFGWHLNFQGV